MEDARPRSKHSIVFDPVRCVGCVDCCKACPTGAIRVQGRMRGGRPRPLHRLRRVHPLVPARGDARGHRHLRGPQALQVHGGPALADPVLAVRQGGGAGPGAAGPPQPGLRRRLRPVGHVRHARERHRRLSLGVPRSVAQDLGHLPRDHPPDPAPLPGHDRQPAADRDRAGAGREAPAPAAGGGEAARPRDIGIFFITPCSAILQSIHHPEALEASYLDGAFSIAEFYGPLLKAIKANGPVENPPPMSERGLLWAMAGGEIAGLRNANTMTVAGVRDVRAGLRPHRGGQAPGRRLHRGLHLPGRLRQRAAHGGEPIRRPAHRSAGRAPARPAGGRRGRRCPRRRCARCSASTSSTWRSTSRPVRCDRWDAPCASRRSASGRRSACSRRLPAKDCAACGAPTCAAHAGDVARGLAKLEDCVFVRIESLQGAVGSMRDTFYD